MKIALALALVPVALAPATPALAASADTPPASTVAPTTAPSAALVARYTFDAGAPGGHVADTSGRGTPLTVRTADQGAIQFAAGAATFPAACATTAATCPRALLEAASSDSLNPGTRPFKWSARVRLARTQLGGSPNIVQKGVANTGSQWKLQLGATNGRAQCVAVGTGSPTGYIVRSTDSVADGTWHKIRCQRYGAALSVYVDDVLRGTAAIPATLNITNNLPLRIGGANFNNRAGMYHGALDDVYAELG